MRSNRHRNGPAQIIFGLFVIVMGMGFLLDNLGWLDFRLAPHFLPLLLVVIGVMKIVQTRNAQGVFVGAALILAGVVLTLKSMGFLFISWHTLWPVFMIGMGLLVVLRSIQRQRDGGRPPGLSTPFISGPQAASGDDSVINITAVMGGFVRRIVTPDFRGGEVTVIMGGCELDLRQSSINGEAVLNVFAIFGGIQVKVPPDWTVVLQGTPILGGFDERTIAPPSSSKRLIIRGTVVMGGVDIRN